MQGNPVKLYRIQDKETKQFWVGTRSYDGKDIWSDKGAFFHNVEPIERWLMYLAGAAIKRETMQSERCVFVIKSGYQKRLQKYRVVVTDVTVKGHKRIEAKNFVRLL